MQNKNLQELFNLPTEEPVFKDLDEPLPDKYISEVKTEAISNLDKINQALTSVKGLDADDGQMDELADLAKSSYKDLIDFGMQVDSRSAGEILSVAERFLGQAISAKTAKMNKKLKMIDLQLKKAKLDLDRGDGFDPDTEVAHGTIMDRNELIAQILEQQKIKAE
ncbi:MAG: hypothetical protein DRQ47_07540 [Gammaproteobacteria bacterium]|nr:MAG: hypothetical protein DRQ47_07540 [Gammaproteobacteria bacterium]